MKKDKNQKKILFYSDCYYFAGCENMLITLLNNPLITKKYDCEFAYAYSNKYEQGLKSRINSNAELIPIKYYSINSWYSIINFIDNILLQMILRGFIKIFFIEYLFFIYDFFRLILIFRKAKPDILHINNGGYPGSYSCLSAVFAARLVGITKIIFVINNIINPYKSIFRYIDYPIDYFVKNNVTRFITGSKYASQSLRKLWNINNEKSRNIPNTIISRPLIETRESVIKRLNIDEGKIILGNIASLEKRKGQKYLIESIALIKNNYPDNYKKIVLIIEGEGREYTNLKYLSIKRGVEEKVIFLKHEKNIFDLINILDVFILSSIENEDFPNVILESMSLGKPVIGTEIAGIPEQIENEYNGLIVKPGDHRALSMAILKMVSNEKMRKEMGINSQARFNKFFSNDKIVNEYIRLYDNLSSN